MIRKDKVFELKIEEDDDVSGIDSISLVDEPAIDVMWIAFNKEKEYEFHIPEGEDEKYLTELLAAGIPESEVFEEGFEIYKIENVTREMFSEPNGSSSLDDEFLVRFKYAKNPDAPGNSIKNTTRDFCRQLVSQDLVYRLEDINFTNDNGDSALTWRGGYNCRHLWQRILYKRTADIGSATKTKGRVYTGPSYTIPGVRQPSTVVKTRPSFAKEKMEVGIPHYTEDGVLYEGPTHKDAEGRLMTGKIHSEDSEYLYHADELESVSDYPVSISNNAKRGIELNEKNNNKCATQVGKVRAQQLANGEPISAETIKRMYSYLSRAGEYYDENDSNACGTISYLLWGGKSALSWAESKLKDFGYDVGTIGGYVDPDIKKKRKKIIEKAVAKPTLFDKKAQYFAADVEKQMVLGPAMIPNQKIFRKDQDGAPYYVFFSPETIKMIASKYMKNKYTDNNDQMHDGEAVKDVYVVESWIKESKNDKSTDYGFGDLPVGTWFVSMKINNPDIWSKVKDKELNGFSVSGFFEEVAAFKREEMFLQKVAEILANIKD